MILRSRIPQLILMFVAVALLPSCAMFGGKSIVVPDKDTVGEQAFLAESQLNDARTVVDEKSRREELRKAVAAFDRVIVRFPDNRVFTPAAMVVKGDVQMELGHHREAEATYREAVRQYAEIPDVHANALYGLAQALETRGKGRESKEYYRRLIDLYGSSTDPVTQRIVRRARVRYDQIL